MSRPDDYDLAAGRPMGDDHAEVAREARDDWADQAPRTPRARLVEAHDLDPSDYQDL